MAESITYGKVTLAEDDEEAIIDAPSVVDKGICQLTLDCAPRAAQIEVTTIQGGRYKIRRKSHHGQRIEIAYRISYGLGRAMRSEA